MLNICAVGLAQVLRVSASILFLAFLSTLVSMAPVGAADQAPSEQRASDALDKVRDDPLALYALLKRMPKGADLHSHVTGATYAESHIRAAIEDKLCVDVNTMSFAKSQPVMAGAEPEPVCEQDAIPASQLVKNPRLYSHLVDAFSMRGFVPSEGETGNDHFFDAFSKFGGTDPRHLGEFVDEVASRAGRQNVQYLELMAAPTWHRLNTITKDVDWTEDLKALRAELLDKGLAEDIPAARAFWDQIEEVRRRTGKCGEPDESPGCKVKTRFIYQVFRNTPKALVFAQAVFGFELASVDPRVVAINLVGDEDDPTAMADYAEHMRMVGFLRGLYPNVHVSLHAGELALGLVPPEGLCCHIRLAVDEAKTDRIGHGVDVMYEDRPEELLRDMADKKVLVEINLTSNQDSLDVSGKHHPLLTYRKFGVPIALSTDDEGIERTDISHEYVRAVQSYDLTYADLKQIVRASLEHSFLPGASLWQERDVFTTTVPDCRGDTAGSDQPGASCAIFLKASEKATQQWELERRFGAFEAAF